VVSRKTHGTAGTFDVDLPLTGTIGVECRAPGPNNTYSLVYTFNKDVTVPGTATKTQGTAVVGVPVVGPDPNQVTIPLQGVTNAQHLAVSLSGVQTSVGDVANNQIAHMDVLIGDVNASGTVTSGDSNLAKAQALQTVKPFNFRTYVNASGSVTTGDVNIIKQNSLTSLP
jgi:hypothetical protein